MISVFVSGAAGRMGREVVKAVVNDPQTRLAGAVDRHLVGSDAGEVAGIGAQQVLISGDLEAALRDVQPEVAVDFSTPNSALPNIRAMLASGVRPVIGTTGLGPADLQTVDELARDAGLPVIIAPNFAIGAILMMRFAAEAAKVFPAAEIIEFHHDQKLDAPSGTALKTAQVMQEARGAAFSHVGGDGPESAAPGSRGAEQGGIAIHSVRLAGYLAHQEVIFGMAGQTLTVRHDTITRECYMPGVLLAVKKVRSLKGLTYGLEHLL